MTKEVSTKIHQGTRCRLSWAIVLCLMLFLLSACNPEAIKTKSSVSPKRPRVGQLVTLDIEIHSDVSIGATITAEFAKEIEVVEAPEGFQYIGEDQGALGWRQDIEGETWRREVDLDSELPQTLRFSVRVKEEGEWLVAIDVHAVISGDDKGNVHIFSIRTSSG